jgi:hypothetical protein
MSNAIAVPEVHCFVCLFAERFPPNASVDAQPALYHIETRRLEDAIAGAYFAGAVDGGRSGPLRLCLKHRRRVDSALLRP